MKRAAHRRLPTLINTLLQQGVGEQRTSFELFQQFLRFTPLKMGCAGLRTSAGCGPGNNASPTSSL
jgi:hypothetical protein